VNTPLAVIREALLQPIPCPKCSSTKACRCLVGRAARIDAQAEMVQVALAEHGLLVDQGQPAAPTGTEMEEVAKFLAEQSRFARYAGEGWRMLLDSDVDVNVAFTKAKAATEGSEKAVTEALGRARDLLVAWIAARRAAKEQG
jgi:hypothetical protein